MCVCVCVCVCLYVYVFFLSVCVCVCVLQGFTLPSIPTGGGEAGDGVLAALRSTPAGEAGAGADVRTKDVFDRGEEPEEPRAGGEDPPG